eukprot:CAMPEP_0118947166 /NCGR_PEP_ID=MMETSP1169-20130426/45513_1 /TAXON_ID=36882 /ORGANISM="Pyramimonas obovata, Strain CCMP722" /LENGTH=99 /DNA_ID=CAMNT_0006893331 /DNA_START=9 /DNA_END=305 /DNA_ORIENTATION=-
MTRTMVYSFSSAMDPSQFLEMLADNEFQYDLHYSAHRMKEFKIDQVMEDGHVLLRKTTTTPNLRLPKMLKFLVKGMENAQRYTAQEIINLDQNTCVIDA